MFGVLQTITMQRIAILAASLIGLACCVAAVLDARSQQEEERRPPSPISGGQATRQDIHHMRGWPLHKGHPGTRALG